MDNPSIISCEPFVIAHKDEIYPILISKLISKINLIQASPFEFKNNNGELIKEKFRYSYPTNEIFKDKEILSIILKFAKHTVPEFIKKLRKEINDKDYKLDNKENIRYCLRVRILEDKEGYSLQPHKDSDDTIFSFILQLDSRNTKTTIYKKGRVFKLTGNISENPNEIKLQVSSAVKKICPMEKIHYGESQFKKNIGMWTNQKFFRYEKFDNLIAIQEYDEQLIKIENQSLYGICNSLIKIILSSKLNKANSVSYHGVRPIIQKSRKLLIMDLIAQPTSKDVLVLQGVNNDSHSYYLIYSPEKCSELTGLLS